MLSPKPFFSVVIPTFNRPQKTKLALKSVLYQKNPNEVSANKKILFFECWLIDDGSKPNFKIEPLLKNAFQKKNIPLTIYHFKKNRGVSTARNQGIKLAQGKWIAFLDSDDLWHPQKLLEQYSYILKNPQYKIIQCEEIWIRNNVKVNPPRHYQKESGAIFKKSLEHCLITPSSVVLKKEFLKKRFLFDESLPACEDYDLWLRITLKEKVGLIKKKLLTRYGGHSDQLSFKYPLMDCFRLKSLKKIINFIKKEKNIDPLKKKWAENIYQKKLQIILKGAWKRKRFFLYFYYWFKKWV